ncbi:unnamed protein product [Echinostoma caproni]|uniref:Protein kinase domain-containing protein n=1 Tax=Echinostoma caproni TaxID=27848 RepID=A0A183B0R2_9TREM|nr:unnamed protein product [Echinostoma caproni]
MANLESIDANEWPCVSPRFKQNFAGFLSFLPSGFINVPFPDERERERISVDAIQVPGGSTVRITYSNVKAVGTGSFGVVYAASLSDDREVAIKKVLQDERYKNRELQILKEMRHPNVVTLFYYFYSQSSSKPGETYLNLVQEFVPQTLSRLIKHYWRIRQVIPLAYVKLYSFQLLRGLAYIHSREVCHRDIKPQNLLINPNLGLLKICDFGRYGVVFVLFEDPFLPFDVHFSFLVFVIAVPWDLQLYPIICLVE